MNYDFMTLSSEDFEHLIRDLFSAEWGSQLESFKSGPDGGIDLRHSRVSQGQKTTIIQCKRYSPSSVARLLRTMNGEKSKINQLKPARYVLVTSVRLSPLNKDALCNALQPWVRSTGDIYGATELNGLLNTHPAVLRSHFKLWISSTTVLESVLHANIFNLTDHTISEVRREVGKLVVHAGLGNALDKLKKNHHVLIVGNAGVGKTTLARMLLSHYVEEGFHAVVVSKDIEEAWKLSSDALRSKARLVIYYDDFLGRTSFASRKFEKNEDSRLLSLFDRVRASKNMRLILTTREYILADARLQHSAFDERADELVKLAINVGDYSKDVRARILFNHLFFSRVPKPFLRRLVCDRSYRKIIASEHFNPRVVERVSLLTSAEVHEPVEFVQRAVAAFTDPTLLWAKLFDAEIPVAAQQILALLWSFDDDAEFDDLLRAFLLLNSMANPETAARDFEQSLKVLDGNFVSTQRVAVKPVDAITPEQFRVIVKFHNPSIEDLVERRICVNTSVWPARLLTAIVSWRQIRFLTWMTRDKGPLDPLKSARLLLGPLQMALLFSAARDKLEVAEGRLHQWYDGRLQYEDGEQVALADRVRTILELAGKSSDQPMLEFVLEILRKKETWIRLVAAISERSMVATDLKQLFRSIDATHALGRLSETDFSEIIDLYQVCLHDNLLILGDQKDQFSVSTWADLCWIFQHWEVNGELRNLVEAAAFDSADGFDTQADDPDEIESSARHAEFLGDTLNSARLSNHAYQERARATQIRDNQEESTSDDYVEPRRVVEKYDQSHDELFALLLDR